MLRFDPKGSRDNIFVVTPEIADDRYKLYLSHAITICVRDRHGKLTESNIRRLTTVYTQYSNALKMYDKHVIPDRNDFDKNRIHYGGIVDEAVAAFTQTCNKTGLDILN